MVEQIARLSARVLYSSRAFHDRIWRFGSRARMASAMVAMMNRKATMRKTNTISSAVTVNSSDASRPI